MTEMTAPEPVQVDPRYYTDGATWERDIARRNRNSRALAWIVAAVMTIVAVGALGTLALLVPLKT
ncbi:VirB8/TrbF family protein, partial [Acinetobacter baumannii]